jgi:hypothetical protein
MRTGFLNNPQSGWLSRLGDTLFLASMNSGWWLWSIHFHKRFRNRPQSLRCDLTVPYFCFPPFKCLSTSHSSDVFGDPVNCRFTCWILSYFPQFPCLRLCFNRLFRPGGSLLCFESVILLVYNLFTEAIEAVKLQDALSASSPELILKPLPICEFVKPVRKISSSNMIQHVENDWYVDYDLWQSDILVHNNLEHVSISCRRVMSGPLWCWNFKLVYMH